MSIGPDARAWFKQEYGTPPGKVYTSKYYLPEESWPKTHVWWLQIPMSLLENSTNENVHLICQVAPSKIDFHYLKVPISFLRENVVYFHKVENKLSLYLSAEPQTLFREQRGTGDLDFSVFKV
jgi:hypothetical protein